MKKTIVLLAVLLATLSACQSTKGERKNNCACNWDKTDTWHKPGFGNEGVIS